MTTLTRMVTRLATLLAVSQLGAASRPAQFPGGVIGPEGELAPTIRTGYTCEGEQLLIQCEEEADIQIVRANYGRFSIAICNDDGKTHWSVNCMSPKTRHILQNKCDNRNSCTVPVSSELFGDPCPGTHKYVEIHYTCSPRTDATRRPLPPWYLQQPSLHSNSEFWLQSAAAGPGRQSELAAAGEGKQSAFSNNNNKQQSSYNSRIPILVATTTSPPPRIPITTPRPTTTTTTTTPPTTTPAAASTTTTTTTTTAAGLGTGGSGERGVATSKAAGVLLQQTNEVVINHEPGGRVAGPDTLYTTIINTESEAAMGEGEAAEFCPPTSARNLAWRPTRGGQVMIQPCPNGATGLARWTCDRGEDAASPATWATPQPDMSDCKSVPMTNLEVKVRQQDPENVIASSLARLTGSRALYGGDLQAAAAVMRTLATRIQFLLQQGEDTFYNRAAFIQEVLLNIVRAASNLLDARNRLAWRDLATASRLKVASSLLLALEENSFLFAEVTNKPEILMESSYNILMAISVLNEKDIRNGSSFPLNSYEEPFGTIEDSILLPPRALETRGRLVKTVFFSWRGLEQLLARDTDPAAATRYRPAAPAQQQLNSRVISASLVRGVANQAPVVVSLKHLKEEGMGSPLCVSWDLASSAWSSLGCSVAATNTSRTVCECDHLGHFAVLMEQQTVPIVIHLPAFHVEIIVGAVISVFLLVTCLVLFKFREQVQKMLKIPCSKEEKKGLENCHKSQSFFNGINLMQAPGQEKSQTLSTSVADSQSRLSQYVLATGAGAEGGERYENVHGDRYEDIQGQDPSSANQATLPMRARMSPHITLNPYSTQLVDNLNRMMTVSPGGHIYQVAGPAPGLAPHLSNLTNTLKKKKKCCNDPRCSRGVAGAQCPHSRTITPLGALASDSSARSESLTPVSGQEQDTDTELLPASASLASAEVVFRAVSPHGHVYWEIDPKRPGRLAGPLVAEDSSGQDLHNMSDFSEEEGRAGGSVAAGSGSERSRQSSRFSDHLPLLSCSAHSSPAHQLHPLPEAAQVPAHRFASLQKAGQQQQQQQFSTRTRLQRLHNHNTLAADPQHQQQQQQHFHAEQVQQQVQIPDLRRLPVSVKSSEYIMAKIQTHMAGAGQGAGHRPPAAPRTRHERQV